MPFSRLPAKRNCPAPAILHRASTHQYRPLTATDSISAIVLELRVCRIASGLEQVGYRCHWTTKSQKRSAHHVAGALDRFRLDRNLVAGPAKFRLPPEPDTSVPRSESQLSALSDGRHQRSKGPLTVPSGLRRCLILGDVANRRRIVASPASDRQPL